MGFSVTFKYHERLEDGSYDKDTVKEMTKKIGSPYDEISYEQLAGSVMAQLARRDVWVVDVEVFEFVKRKLSFKETKNGFLIHNKKFSFSDCGTLAVTEVQEDNSQVAVQQQVFKPQMQNQLVPVNDPSYGNAQRAADVNLAKRRPLRFEVFDPDPVIIGPEKIRGLAFRKGEKYPIFEEKPAGSSILSGMNYVTMDDHGKKQVLNDKYFVPIGNLIGGEAFNEPIKKDMQLDFGSDGGYDLGMPKLR